MVLDNSYHNNGHAFEHEDNDFNDQCQEPPVCGSQGKDKSGETSISKGKGQGGKCSNNLHNATI
jgi:hypothetical protein